MKEKLDYEDEDEADQDEDEDEDDAGTDADADGDEDADGDKDEDGDAGRVSLIRLDHAIDHPSRRVRAIPMKKLSSTCSPRALITLPSFTLPFPSHPFHFLSYSPPAGPKYLQAVNPLVPCDVGVARSATHIRHHWSLTVISSRCCCCCCCCCL
jgi:hypothetical protein